MTNDAIKALIESMENFEHSIGELVKPSELSGFLNMHKNFPQKVEGFNKQFLTPSLKAYEALTPELAPNASLFTNSEVKLLQEAIRCADDMSEIVKDLVLPESSYVSMCLPKNDFDRAQRMIKHDSIVQLCAKSNSLVDALKTEFIKDSEMKS